jgi:hypothetical protein
MTPGFFKGFGCLQVPDGVALAYIFFEVNPECDDQINDYRGSHGNEREVNKVQPDTRRGNAPSFTKIAANSKRTLFYKVFKPFHCCCKQI